MGFYQNEFVKGERGFVQVPKQQKKSSQPSHSCDVGKKCPPAKPSPKAKVTQVDSQAVELGLDGNVLNVPVIDAPVALAEVELTANVEACFTLPTFATEIKNIRKNVSLKQCRAVPSLAGPGFVSLFITGVIHKNIQYSDGSGFIRDFAIDVPFSSNQTIALINPRDPSLISVKSSVAERRELAKDGHGADRCTHSQINFEFFNEPIKCKLLASFINEIDLLKDFNKHGQFRSITEKMEVLLFLKLTQTQQVALAETNNNAESATIRSRIEQLRQQTDS
ncbi:CsxC family protein [Halalkalibacter hemicellulosilyticus]|uniref:Uncharacterized protein n=1 Tax=Halalkalibacter hemicellulosilyticusJCM 9152 TaxID=1236971 RepID=W4QFS1_9BACI|nr:hypothetical protein [Halalkalibacter hemicellulosilyticus]GAE30935.1 hypothetical protein JCM9152_2368 [Halalkalibacter hemicellulosilyticusJCM 9152]